MLQVRTPVLNYGVNLEVMVFVNGAKALCKDSLLCQISYTSGHIHFMINYIRKILKLIVKINKNNQ